jgi:hypothetical protein
MGIQKARKLGGLEARKPIELDKFYPSILPAF